MTARARRVAVVTIAHGRHDHLDAQHRSLARGTRRPELYVVVGMDDVALGTRTLDGLQRRVVHLDRDPRGLPLAAARNRGAETAVAAGAEVIVFLDVDCLAGPDLVRAYAAAVGDDPTTVWSGPVTYLPPPPLTGYPLDLLPSLDSPHPVRPAPAPGQRQPGGDPDLFWSLSFALGATAWTRSGGFCEEYVGYGGEDTDFARVLRDSGVGLGWEGSARAYHQHHEVERPPVRHLDDILRNARIFARRWGTWPMAGWLTEFEAMGLAVHTPHGWVHAQPRRTPRPPVLDVRVVVPAHDEQDHIGSCLVSLGLASAALRSTRPEVTTRVVVVLDRCSDDTAAIAAGFDVDLLPVHAGSVGAARRDGVAHVARELRDRDPAGVLVLNTDADSVVPSSWLVEHHELALHHDLVQGEVRPDPADLSPAVLSAWQARNPAGSGSLHGANLAFRLEPYLAVGGFADVGEHEDLLLVRALTASGFAAVCGGATVQTSGRRTGRLLGGFAGYLRDLDDELA